MTLRSYLENIAKSLGDFDGDDADNSHQRWELSSLLAWYNEAQCVIASYKPQDFVKTKVMKLQAGTTQNPCCNQVSAPLEYVDVNGAHISYLRPLDAKAAARPFRGATCAILTNPTYMPKNSWKMDGASNSFEMYPPVPSNGNFYVKIRCVESPMAKDIADLDSDMGDCRYSAPASEWVMFKALSGETDTHALNNAQLHYKAFFDLMGMQVKSMEKFINSQATWNSSKQYQVGVSVA
jgi:hypothetical protein